MPDGITVNSKTVSTSAVLQAMCTISVMETSFFDNIEPVPKLGDQDSKSSTGNKRWRSKTIRKLFRHFSCSPRSTRIPMKPETDSITQEKFNEIIPAAPPMDFSAQPNENIAVWAAVTTRRALDENWPAEFLIFKAVATLGGRAEQWASRYLERYPETGCEAYWNFVASIVWWFNHAPDAADPTSEDDSCGELVRPDPGQPSLELMNVLLMVGQKLMPWMSDREQIRRIVYRMSDDVQDRMKPVYLNDFDAFLLEIKRISVVDKDD